MDLFVCALEWLQSISTVWLVCGILLVLMEWIVPGFVICFFGASAICMGVLVQLFPSMAIVYQILLFAILSVAMVVLSRRLFPSVFKGNKSKEQFDIDEGDFRNAYAVVKDDIAEGDVDGEVAFEGSIWKARSSESFSSGEKVKVVGRDNLTLIIEKIK